MRPKRTPRWLRRRQYQASLGIPRSGRRYGKKVHRAIRKMKGK